MDEYYHLHRRTQLQLGYVLQKLDEVDLQICYESNPSEEDKKLHKLIIRIRNLYRKIKCRSVNDLMLNLKIKLTNIIYSILSKKNIVI